MVEAPQSVSSEIINLVREQTKTNTQVLERLDRSNDKLTSIDCALNDAVQKYAEFTVRMEKIQNNMKWGMAVGIAIGLPIAFSLIKMAFF
jgi:hypothetical protein